jgi:hypothetical protein
VSDAVREFVANAHGDLEAVRAVLGEDSTFANAAWDWGGGDWETALGAASPLGRRDIAELLIANGARIDIFVAAMLEARPGTRDARGPHGIPLRAHAEAGGEQAALVLAYLDA